MIIHSQNMIKEKPSKRTLACKNSLIRFNNHKLNSNKLLFNLLYNSTKTYHIVSPNNTKSFIKVHPENSLRYCIPTLRFWFEPNHKQNYISCQAFSIAISSHRLVLNLPLLLFHRKCESFFPMKKTPHQFTY